MPWGWEEFELWSCSSCCLQSPEVGSLFVMASAQMFATHAGRVQVVAASLPSLAPTSPPPPSWPSMAWLALPQWSSMKSCRTRWKQGVGLSPSCPLLITGLSPPLCQPCSFFPPGQAGLFLASQCLLQSQVTSPPQSAFWRHRPVLMVSWALPSLLTSVSFATGRPRGRDSYCWPQGIPST